MTRPTASPGESIRTLRLLAGLTLADVAEAAGTSTAYLSKVERGELVPTHRYIGQVTSTIARSLAEGEKVPA